LMTCDGEQPNIFKYFQLVLARSVKIKLSEAEMEPRSIAK